MITLLNASRVNTRLIGEYESAITCQRLVQHSEWRAKVPASEYAYVAAASYAVMNFDTTLYLVEWYNHVTQGGVEYVEVGGRSATALLAQRTVDGVEAWTGVRPATVVGDLIATLTGDRAIPGLTFADTSAVSGSEVTMQRSWGRMDEACMDALASTLDAGWKATLAGTDIIITVYDVGTSAALYGEKWGNSTGAVKKYDERGSANYAYVRGEGEGDARVCVEVDLSGADARRELDVDARDLQSEMTVSIPVTITATSDRLTCPPHHNLVVGNRIRLSDLSGGAPLANATDYYVTAVPTSITIEVSTTLGGEKINITGNGTATITTLEINAAQYAAVLTQRGREKLAEAAIADYVDNAVITAPVAPGTLLYYDTGVWNVEMHTTQLETVDEGGTVDYRATIGEVPKATKETWVNGGPGAVLSPTAYTPKPLPTH